MCNAAFFKPKQAGYGPDHLPCEGRSSEARCRKYRSRVEPGICGWAAPDARPVMSGVLEAVTETIGLREEQKNQYFFDFHKRLKGWLSTARRVMLRRCSVETTSLCLRALSRSYCDIGGQLSSDFQSHLFFGICSPRSRRGLPVVRSELHENLFELPSSRTAFVLAPGAVQLRAGPVMRQGFP